MKISFEVAFSYAVNDWMDIIFLAELGLPNKVVRRWRSGECLFTEGGGKNRRLEETA
jgi:hypothetical protein